MLEDVERRRLGDSEGSLLVEAAPLEQEIGLSLLRSREVARGGDHEADSEPTEEIRELRGVRKLMDERPARVYDRRKIEGLEPILADVGQIEDPRVRAFVLAKPLLDDLIRMDRWSVDCGPEGAEEIRRVLLVEDGPKRKDEEHQDDGRRDQTAPVAAGLAGSSRGGIAEVLAGRDVLKTAYDCGCAASG